MRKDKCKDKYGYIHLYMPNYPRAHVNGFIKEHIYIAETKILHRLLKHDEVVHHINGIKDDNRPENLMIFRTQLDHLHYHKTKKAWLNDDGSYSSIIKPTKEELIDLLKEHKGNVAIIAKEIDVDPRTIFRWTKKYDLNLSNYRIKPTKEELIDLLKEYKGNCSRIGKELNVSYLTIINWSKTCNINPDDYKLPEFSKEELLHKLSINNYSGRAVSINVGKSNGYIWNLCQLYHINIPKSRNNMINIWNENNFNINAVSDATGIPVDNVLDMSKCRGVVPAIYFVDNKSSINDKLTYPRFDKLIEN